MKKRLELLVRLVDGGQLYWDAAAPVEAMSVEEIEAMMPRTAEARANADARKKVQEHVREKFREAADQLWERAMQRIR